MILLTSTSDKLQVVTSAAAAVDVHASWVDSNNTTGALTPGRTNTAIAIAATTDIVAAPSSSIQRNARTLHIRNKHATVTTDVTVQHTDGTTTVQLHKVTLLAGAETQYTDDGGWEVPEMGPAGTTGGGNVSNSGTPTSGQIASWTDATHIQGVAVSSLGLQPLDADLTALAALAGTNMIPYRSAPDTWAAVTIGTNLTFSGGTLSAAGGGIADAPNDGVRYVRQSLGWVSGDAVYQPLDGDLTSLAAASATGAIYYRSAANTWAVVTISTGLSFAAGTLSSTLVGLTDGNKGDITVSGSGTAWAINAATVTYAKMQNVSVTARILGRKTAGAGSPEECTLSDVLDFIGSAAQGDILYRGAATWARLPAGTSGQVLQTGGAGANPSWVTPAAGGGGGGLLAVQVFSTAGAATYTPTSGMTSCIIELVGGGGGGGGGTAAASTVSSGGGGGAGGYSRALVTAASIGASISVTVGAAGTAASNAAGGAGGDTFVGTSLGAALCAARGGSGGARDTGSGTGQGGLGGIITSAVGQVIVGGSAGGFGGTVSPSGLSNTGGGVGGSSFFGGGGRPAALPLAGAIAGGAATGAGSGGGGGTTYNTGNCAGGAGAAGMIVITEYK